MLTYQDEQTVKKIVKDEIKPLEKKIDRIENNVDKILKIVTTDRQELTVTKARVNSHHKRLTKIEKKLGFPPVPAVALA